MTRRGQLAEVAVHGCTTAAQHETPLNFPPATWTHCLLTLHKSLPGTGTIAQPLCSEQYLARLVIGQIQYFAPILSFESNSALSRKPVRIANEVRLMNESAEGIKLLWDEHCSWFQAMRQAGMEDWWIAIVHSLVQCVTPDVWPGSPSTSDTPLTQGTARLDRMIRH